MRRLTKIFITFFTAAMLLNSCYDDYRFDYEYSAVYFALQNPDRTVVVDHGEGLTIELGITLAGKYKNEKTEIVGFEIAPELLSEYEQFTLLPENYYELSNSSKIEIPVGAFLGTVELTLNDNFVNDVDAVGLHYALPVKITSSSTDSILGGKDYTIIALRFQNKYYGGYWIKGVDYTLDASGAKIEEYAYSNEDLTSNTYKIFSSESKDKSVVGYTGLDISGDNSMKLEISEGGTVTVSTGAVKNISEITGGGTYDADSKTFYLDYTYMKGEVKHEVHDTLIYFSTPMSMETW